MQDSICTGVLPVQGIWESLKCQQNSFKTWISVKNVLNTFLKDIMMRESDISKYDFNDGDGDDDDDDDCG